jgi:hypothetical protein
MALTPENVLGTLLLALTTYILCQAVFNAYFVAKEKFVDRMARKIYKRSESKDAKNSDAQL